MPTDQSIGNPQIRIRMIAGVRKIITTVGQLLVRVIGVQIHAITSKIQLILGNL